MDDIAGKADIDFMDKSAEGGLIFPTDKRYKPTKKKRPVRTIGNVLSWVFIALLMLLVLTLFLALMQSRSEGPPILLGHQLFVVRSNSMSPAFDIGSLIVTEQLDVEQIKVGDIVTYKQNNGAAIITHRVVDILEDDGIKFLTRGDANLVDDPMPVDSGAVYGRVVAFIPYLGYIVGFAGTKAGIAILLIVPGTIIFLHQTVQLIRHLKKKKESIQQAS